jgi:hypothetical protein
MARHSPPVLPPTWVMVLGSVLVLLHFYCAAASALNVYSGPWVWATENATSDADAAPFVTAAWRAFDMAKNYQQYVKVTGPFRFASLKQEDLEISAELVLRDATGKIITRQKLPDPEASTAIQYRQRWLAHQLGNDVPLPPQESIIIAAPGQKLPVVRYWVNESDHRLVLKEADPNTVPRNQTFRQPSFGQYIMAKSFVRHKQRQYPDAKVELLRSWYNPINPTVLYEETSPSAEILRGFTSSYGELRP